MHEISEIERIDNIIRKEIHLTKTTYNKTGYRKRTKENFTAEKRYWRFT